MRHKLPDGLELHYEIHGDANAEQAIVFLNGLSQSTAVWAGVVYTLGKKYKILLVDLLCQGKADVAPVYRSFEEHAADLAHLLEALHLPSATVVGISFGGAVAQRLLVNYPSLVHKGVLLSTFSNVDAYLAAILKSWKQALQAGGYPLMLEVMLPAVLSRHYFLKPVVSIENLKKAKGAKNLNQDSLLKLMAAMEVSKNYLSELNKVQVPVLVVHGQEDIVCPPVTGKTIHEALPKAELMVIPGVGHTLNLECMPELIRLIDSFTAS